MRRPLLVGIMVCGFVLVGQGSHPASAVPAAAQATERVEFREAPPSCAQAIKELHLEGQPVDCEEPPPPTYDPPQMHGPYRLIAPTYVGPLTYRDDPAPAFPVGAVSEDLEVLQRSPLYRPPAWLPEGYNLETLKTGETGSEDVLGALYTGSGQPVSIIWIRRYTWPLDVILPGPDSVLGFEALTVGGNPAILWYPRPGSPAAPHLTTALSYVEGDVEVTVMGEQLHPEAAKAIALSMACGAACVPLEPGGLGVEGVPGAQSADGAASPGGAPDAALVLLSSEARILEGLGTLSDFVNVIYHEPPEDSYWHGFDYPGAPEAALDLTDPDGSTADTNVYYLAWLDAPGASITATTEDYHISSHCTGRYVKLTDTDDPNHVYGRLTYVHLKEGESLPAPGDHWTTGSMWTVRYLGKVATWQEAGCTFTGPHLHQGQTLSSSDITYNAALPNPGAVIDPTWDYENNWMFKVTILDSDGDGCSDQEELGPNPNLGGQRDPHNPYDFYDVPVPTLHVGGHMWDRDKAVTIINDVLAVLQYTAIDYHEDRDGDGVDDGRAYDRSAGGAWSGPPDGAITILVDALLVLAQSGHTAVQHRHSTPPVYAVAMTGGRPSGRPPGVSPSDAPLCQSRSIPANRRAMAFFASRS